MLKYAIEVQDTDGEFVKAAEGERRYTNALATLETLTGEGTYRIRFGRTVKFEKAVIVDQPQVTAQYGIGAKVVFGKRGKVVWEVFMNAKPGFVSLNPAHGGGANKYDVPVTKLAPAPKSA